MLNKKFLLIILPLLALGLLILSNPTTVKEKENKSNSSRLTMGQIKAGMTLGSKHVITTNDTRITVGNPNTAGPIAPQVTLSQEKKGVSLGINYPVDPGATVETQDNKITWKEQTKELYFKQATGNVPKYEFDILLKEKPQSSTFTYNLDTNNLEFSFNEVSNTYSAYKKGYQDEKGIYNKGELFRIERPKITDAKGSETWGKLNIDNSNNKLAVTVADSWLASAAYPVTVDPTIVLNDTNHVLITKVDRFRWKLALEYEIRNDEGKLLGSDVVIMETNPGETKDQIFGLFKDYLTRRDAVWLLSQGNYTLYEMSMDRLSAVHFQTADSADDVKDEHEGARQTRKQIIESITKQDYPTYSLTLEQAGLLQRPDKPTFTVANEKPGAGTEILRPDSAGDATAIPTQFPASGAHWDKVDEASADDATTYLQSDVIGPFDEDDFNLGATALTTETVNSIDVTHRVIGTDPGGYSGSQGGIRRASTNTAGATRNPGLAWTTYTDSAIARPGGGSWVVGDLAALQVVIKLAGYDDFDTITDNARGTQVYVTVNYTAGGGTPTPVRNIRGGSNFIPGSKF